MSITLLSAISCQKFNASGASFCVLFACLVGRSAAPSRLCAERRCMRSRLCVDGAVLGFQVVQEGFSVQAGAADVAQKFCRGFRRSPAVNFLPLPVQYLCKVAPADELRHWSQFLFLLFHELGANNVAKRVGREVPEE